MSVDRNFDGVNQKLQSFPLFAEMDDYEPVEYELGLFYGTEKLPADSQPRPSYVSVEAVSTGDVLVSQGELTTRFAVVVEGSVGSYHADSQSGTDLFVTHAEGDWFGEVSAISHQPSLTTLRAETDSLVVTLDQRLFKKLFLEDEGFKERIDEVYADRSLLLHLRVAPLFAGLSKRELLAVKEKAEFLRLEEEAGGEVIATEGEDADAFYLVRGGAVKCYTEVNGRQRVLAYYMGNSSFGEHAIATLDRRWPGTYETMTWTDLVKIPRDVFESVRQENPQTHQVLTNTANLILGGDPEQLERLFRKRVSQDEIDVMVYKESIKGGNALVIDKDRCIRCNACVEACASVHDDRTPRISKIGTQVSSHDVLITACYHCSVPECMASCGYGAIRRDSQGTVVFVYDNCVGCASCVESCPYDVIRITDPLVNHTVMAASKKGTGLLQGLMGLFKKRVDPTNAQPAERSAVPSEVMSFANEQNEVQAKAIKCDRCAGLPFEACVYNCPTFAIERRKPEELFKA